MTFCPCHCNTALMEFNVGDVVYSKDNPEILMTVSFVLGKTKVYGSFGKLLEEEIRELGYIDGDVECSCFVGLEFKYGCFSTNELEIHSRCNTCLVFKPGDIVYLRSNPENLMNVSFVLKKKSIFLKKI